MISLASLLIRSDRQAISKARASAIKSGFRGCLRDVELLCGFSHRALLHHARLNYFLQVRRQFVNRPSEPGVPLPVIAGFFWARRQVFEVHVSDFVAPFLWGAKRELRPRTPPAKNHQRRVDCNSRQPRIKARSALKAADGEKCSKKRFLHCVFGIFPISW